MRVLALARPQALVPCSAPWTAGYRAKIGRRRPGFPACARLDFRSGQYAVPRRQRSVRADRSPHDATIRRAAGFAGATKPSALQKALLPRPRHDPERADRAHRHRCAKISWTIVHDIDLSALAPDAGAERGVSRACRGGASSSPMAAAIMPRAFWSASAWPMLFDDIWDIRTIGLHAQAATRRPIERIVAAAGLRARKRGDVRGHGAQSDAGPCVGHDHGLDEQRLGLVAPGPGISSGGAPRISIMRSTIWPNSFIPSGSDNDRMIRHARIDRCRLGSARDAGRRHQRRSARGGGGGPGRSGRGTLARRREDERRMAGATNG